nr:piggyBac transposable element-derived protein 4 isoform X2 [Microcebus murinus]
MDFESHIPFFRSVFKRERFLQIFWMLHLKNDQKSSKSLRTRTEKVNCFLSYLEMKFRERFCPGREIAVDEAVVGFKGKVHFITYNPKKPTKWGIRLYVLSDSKCGYVHSFVPYYGGITSETLVRPDLPFTSRIVLEPHERLKNSVPSSQGYHFFTDRYYPSVTLAKELFKEKTHLTGTIMSNRKDNPPVIKHPKLKKGEIVAFRNENVTLLAWKDKRKIKGGRREMIYIRETCEGKPGLHVGECFKKYHTMKNYRD